LSYRRAIAIQRRLAGRVITKNDAGRIRYVAGLDAAFSSDGKDCLAAAVLWDLRAAAVCAQSLAVRRVRMPYIPGLLSFREAPALLAALRRLPRVPDLLLCDGQGLAHPRRFGVACHLGVLCDLPSVGCAKSRLTGTHREPGWLRGSWTRLEDDGEVIGSVLRTREGARPVYVSIGHRVSLARARALVMKCLGEYRLPEPTRLADRLVAHAKRCASCRGHILTAAGIAPPAGGATVSTNSLSG
jgi:deoxyribonuclease V